MDKTLSEIIHRIVEGFHPDKIILFGSRTALRFKDSSDYDICVLKKGIRHNRKLAQEIYRKLFGVGGLGGCHR